MRIDGAMGDVNLLSPDAIQNLVTGDHFARVLEQQFEELKFFVCQLNRSFSFQSFMLL